MGILWMHAITPSEITPIEVNMGVIALGVITWNS